MALQFLKLPMNSCRAYLVSVYGGFSRYYLFFLNIFLLSFNNYKVMSDKVIKNILTIVVEQVHKKYSETRQVK